MMMMALGGAVCPVRNKTDNSSYKETTSDRRLFQQELSARRLRACHLCGTWSQAAGSDVPACGAACSTLSAAVQCSEGVPSGILPRSQGLRSPATSTAPSRDSCIAHKISTVFALAIHSKDVVLLFARFFQSLPVSSDISLSHTDKSAVPRRLVTFHILWYLLAWRQQQCATQSVAHVKSRVRSASPMCRAAGSYRCVRSHSQIRSCFCRNVVLIRLRRT